MPNWVRNNVKIQGCQGDLTAIKRLVRTKDEPFDFNAILPMPEELNLASGSSENVAMACAKAKREGKTSCKEIETSTWTDKMTFEEWAELGEKYLSNVEKYGAATWYDWHIWKWGTKWQPSEVSWDFKSENEMNVSFDTAWSPPTGVYDKLAKMFPNVYMYIEYADEDIGRNCGLLEYDENGYSEEVVDTVEFACNVWGYDYEEYMQEYTTDE